MPCAGDLDDASTPTFNGLTVETGGSGAKGRRETRAYLGDQKNHTLCPSPPHLSRQIRPPQPPYEGKRGRTRTIPPNLGRRQT